MKKIIITIMCLLSSLPAVSLAAGLYFDSPNNVLNNNEDFIVKVLLDTKGVAVNAVEGEVDFSPEILELKEVRDGNSSINFWVDEPKLKSDGQIVFSGITSLGYTGPKMFLFSLVFHTKHSGNSMLDFKNVQILKNDGLGTKLPVSDQPLSLVVSTVADGKMPQDLGIIDTNPPEDFSPSFSRDPNIFNDQYFAVFSTVDKGAGVASYSVKESYFFGLDGQYIIAKSPYLLNQQNLLADIYIKAVDRNGNERIAKLTAQNHLAWLLKLIFFVIILGILYFICKKIILRFSK